MSDSTNKIEPYIAALLDHSDTAEITPKLQSALENDPAAMDEYLGQIRTHAMLQWRAGNLGTKHPGEVSAKMPTSPRPPWKSSQILALAATFVLVAGLAMIIASKLIHQKSRQIALQSAPALDIAEVSEVTNVIWDPGQPALQTGQRLFPGKLSIASGIVRIRSSTGATATIFGPAKVQMLSAMHFRAAAGKLTVHVEERARGFSVETPGANVVDLGTEFGLHVDDAGQTDVVVFEGTVDIAPKTSNPTRRLLRGEGTHLSLDGKFSRILAVERSATTGGWSNCAEDNATDAIISSVRDNLHDDAADTKYYEIVPHGLNVDARAYVDRSYKWIVPQGGEFPRPLIGADFVKTFNSDKRQPELRVALTLTQPATIYVFYDERAMPPEWLTKEFKLTGMKIAMDETTPDVPGTPPGKKSSRIANRPFSVWEQKVERPGLVVLGLNDAKSMYGIAAVATPGALH